MGEKEMSSLMILVVLCIIILLPALYVGWDTARNISLNKRHFDSGNKSQIQLVMNYNVVYTIGYIIFFIGVIRYAEHVIGGLPQYHATMLTAMHNAASCVILLAFIGILNVMAKGKPTTLDLKTFKKFQFRSVGCLIGFFAQFIVIPTYAIVLAVIVLTT